MCRQVWRPMSVQEGCTWVVQRQSIQIVHRPQTDHNTCPILLCKPEAHGDRGPATRRPKSTEVWVGVGVTRETSQLMPKLPDSTPKDLRTARNHKSVVQS
uniref:Uncharacterized protein n=1 Tax=Eutreptiella gymnastica TaxID=73025 RepID=A0A7S4FY60_9EUGL|mmetsp:Transcript_69498/g.115835  ORF Transcript_69498/g.115835 Transcript_69498/m.115835 type:complete len:100 (-) Transcript_69498:564-863(-)|eukprot:CAMPEP_0174327910 /NCGR_PEP_ID=MMETSP0810-20121108/14791_1 /TAXON_ID=73025 ORGANISM="Eutreptiella gymnastica-like, Strain CCMP1594" /NCGR_SAMPLE_ID=MMETSP0810 /ASSEMBLY_ACC=CAM_ASM_000659 /LENGTH=99 /DNA_ID=CAMNT_0015441833 /DNA_START=119 /DNA_END=418 /DNA_ORIENTATION=+